MNRSILYIAALLFVVSCKTPKQIPGVPTIKKERELIERIEATTVQSEYTRIKASGKFEQGEESQNFKAEIRMKRDSIIWIELSDPLVGIKAARAFITPDSIAFVNKIQNEYFAGSFDYLNTKLGTRVDFELLQNLILGEPLRAPQPGEAMDLQLMDNHYALYYYPEQDPLFQFTHPNYYFEIEPDHFDILRQEATDGGQKIRRQIRQIQRGKWAIHARKN